MDEGSETGMGGLFLVRDDDAATATLAAARAQYGRHGFVAFDDIALPGWRGFHCPFIHGGPDGFLTEGDDLVAVAGTLIVDGELGAPALRKLIAMIALGEPDWSRIGGQFVALVRAAGRTVLFTDFFGAFQLFHDDGWRVLSTSFLAAADTLPALSFDPQGVYEFVFNVFPIGDDSVLAELKRLGPDRLLRLNRDGVTVTPLAKPLPETPVDMPLADRIDDVATRLRATVAPAAAVFGDRVDCPLSGGLDSRLVLALLRDAGIAPNIYVYGDADDAGETDVVVARAIAAAEGFALSVEDKASFRAIDPADFADQVRVNFHETDALVTDGGLFDNGGNAWSRHQRHRGGRLAVSGGCGEVLRNFFYLADRPLKAGQLVRSFFARYTLADVTSAFDPRVFEGALTTKLVTALGEADLERPLPRTLIEQAYPRVRCRAFFGREASVVGRHGAYLLPFFDHRVVEAGLRVPMAQKYAGRFEAAVLAAIDPGLARHQSAYGHDFTGPPDRRHRFEEWSTRIRPTWARGRTYALRRRLGPVADEHGGLLTPAYLGRVIDLNFPAMRRFFHTRAVSDSGAYRRIATLEYLAGHLGDRLKE